MRTIYDRLGDAKEFLFGEILNGDKRKTDFKKVMMIMTERAAREMTEVSDPDLIREYKALIKICFELADGAQAALEESKGKANPDVTPEGTRDEVV